jgi:hypothetical protein
MIIKLMLIIIVIRHEYKRGTVWGGEMSRREEGEGEGVRDEYDQNTLHKCL